MKVLVLNCGSSSIKYKLFEMTNKEVLAQGGIEKIGLPGSFLKMTLPNGEKKIIEKDVPERNTQPAYSSFSTHSPMPNTERLAICMKSMQ